MSDLIEDVVESEPFRGKYGDNARIDMGRGIVGWSGKRSGEENARKKLSHKSCKEILTNLDWKDH